MAQKMTSNKIDNPENATNYTDRVNFFIGVLIYLIVNLFFFIIFYQIIGGPPDQLTLEYLSVLWIGNALIALIAGTISVYIIKALLKHTESYPPLKANHLTIHTLFSSFTLRKPVVQLKHTLFLVCCVYIPLDLFSYLIPGVLEFSGNSMLSSPLGQYLLWEFAFMLLATLIVHFCVSFREEFLFRNYYIAFGTTKLRKGVVFLYSAMLFGLAHLSYIFSPAAAATSPFFPIWWGFNALIIGLVSGYYFLKYRRLWPLILAHWLNNLISALVLRNYLLGRSFIESILTYYMPFLVIGLIFLMTKWNSVEFHSKQILTLLTDYKKDIIESHSKLLLVVDIALIIIIWLFTTFTF
jgi:membrane protease YdiL (CAAX protease family)